MRRFLKGKVFRDGILPFCPMISTYFLVLVKNWVSSKFFRPVLDRNEKILKSLSVIPDGRGKNAKKYNIFPSKE
jgi:hypothetical protein